MKTDMTFIALRGKNIRRLLALILLGVLLLALLNMGGNTAYAVTSGEAGAPSADNTVPSSPGCSTVQYAGKTWDIIGWNKGVVSKGIAGPSGTVTLLLDKNSYDISQNCEFDDTSPYSNDYAGSKLQSAMSNYASSIGATSDANVVSRNLAGDSALSIASQGYNGDSIAGAAANEQKTLAVICKRSIAIKR